jgi:glycosyltransferase involved in cell wall biosynthesis
MGKAPRQIKGTLAFSARQSYTYPIMVSVTPPDATFSQKRALVIPCFNESKRLNFQAFSDFIKHHPSIIFCFVNDGSTDDTLQKLHHFALQHTAEQIRIVALAQNQGKAEAVREGVLAMLSDASLHVDLIGFWDSDLATPLSELERFIQAFRQSDALQAVVGFRKKEANAKIQRSFSRKIISAIMHTIIRHYIGLPIHDTQCGAKMFTAILAANIFETPFIARWIFDIEIFLRIKHFLGPDALLKNVEQLHLKAWHDVPGTKLRARDGYKIFFELFRIKAHYRIWVDQNTR